MLKMKMAFFVGIFVAAPYILYQVWAFVVSRPLPRTRRGTRVPFIAAGTLFFLGGAAFGHYYLFPMTFRFLVDFGGADMQFLPKVGEYYAFYSWFLLGLGIVFQLPGRDLRALAHRPRDAGLPAAEVQVRGARRVRGGRRSSRPRPTS